MKTPVEEIRQQVDERNRIRREAHLPPLDMEREVRDVQQAERAAGFEQYFNARRPHYEHLWSDRSRGWLSNSGIYSSVRRRLHDEWLEQNPAP